MHFAASLQIVLEEHQGPEEGAVVLQDLDVVGHIAVHLKILLGLHGRDHTQNQVSKTGTSAAFSVMSYSLQSPEDIATIFPSKYMCVLL